MNETLARTAGGAFFDIDGTLLPGTSAEAILARRLLLRSLPGQFRIVPFLREALRLLITHGPVATRKANKAYLAGATAEEIRSLAKRLFAEEILPRLPTRAGSWIERERQRGRAVVLLSGIPDLLLEPIAHHLGADHAIGTPLEIDARGRLTGRRAGPHPYGRTKRELAIALAIRYGWSPAACSAYGDHGSDIHLLAWVGEPYAVDPDRTLRQAARRRGWPILEPIAVEKEPKGP